MGEVYTVLSILNTLRSTYQTYKCISDVFVDKFSDFLSQISDMEFDSAIMALRESVYSKDNKREIEIAISHMRLAIEKTKKPINEIKIDVMIAFCYKMLNENELMNLYKEKAISIFNKWLNFDLKILKSTNLKNTCLSSDSFVENLKDDAINMVKLPVNILKRSNIVIFKKHDISLRSKLEKVGLDIYSIENASDDYLHHINIGFDDIETNERDKRFITEAKKEFRDGLDKYYSSF